MLELACCQPLIVGPAVVLEDCTVAVVDRACSVEVAAIDLYLTAL